MVTLDRFSREIIVRGDNWKEGLKQQAWMEDVGLNEQRLIRSIGNRSIGGAIGSVDANASAAIGSVDANASADIGSGKEYVISCLLNQSDQSEIVRSVPRDPIHSRGESWSWDRIQSPMRPRIPEYQWNSRCRYQWQYRCWCTEYRLTEWYRTSVLYCYMHPINSRQWEKGYQ